MAKQPSKLLNFKDIDRGFTMPQSIRITFLSFLLILSCWKVQVFAQTTNTWSSEFMARMDHSIGQGWDDAGDRLSASIFESITDQEFFKTNVVGDVQASLKVQRKIYDNQDILDSWTVMDIMRAPLYLPIPLMSDDMNLSGGSFGLKLGINFTGVAYNIRQVKPGNIDKLIRTQELQRKLNEAKEIGDQIIELGSDEDSLLYDNNDEEDDNIIDTIANFAFWSKNNPKVRARYSKLWNILTHPLSIPLSKKAFDRYPVGNISSYGVEGSVQLGASIGWDQFDVTGLSAGQIQAGVGLSTYISGDFRISILKEDENHAQVKLTKVRNVGQTFSLGQTKLEYEIFEGFIIAGNTVLNIKEEIIPFSVVFNRNQAKQFDVAYRYDLSKLEAAVAYEKATLGRFKASEELSKIEGSGVERSFTREQIERRETVTNKVKLSILFESATSSSRATTKAIISLGKEKHHLFSSENIQYTGYDTLWGTSESKKHSFITSVILDDPNHFTPEKVSLRVEGRIDDSHTTVKELASYYSEVETALQKELLFPRPPAYNLRLTCEELVDHLVYSYVKEQCENEDNGIEEKSDYGQVSFFYQLDLGFRQLEIIRNTDKDDMWAALEKAYGVDSGNWSSTWRRGLSFLINSPLTLLNIPLYLANLNIPNGGRLISAIKFYRAWKKLRKVKDSKEFVTAFGKLFRTVYFSAEIVKAIRILTAHEKVPYFFTAKAERIWGQMSSAGDSMGRAIPLIQEANDIIEFDRAGPRANGDRTAIVEKINLKKISRTAIKINFTLSETPEYLYFRIDRSPSWGRYKNLMKAMILNQGNFKKGDNEFIVDIENSTGFMKTLAEKLFNGKYSTLLLAYSIEEQNFGPVNSTRFEFEYEPLDDDEEENKDQEVISNQLLTGAQ
tara:strand:+ start:34468 stop:37161 length:2694 start_codon:yes stop_codon:yes gene_type:complete